MSGRDGWTGLGRVADVLGILGFFGVTASPLEAGVDAAGGQRAALPDVALGTPVLLP